LQIRGGEAGSLARLSVKRIYTLDDLFGVLMAIDWQAVNRFADESYCRETCGLGTRTDTARLWIALR
jgi:hypothetical protein